MRARSTLAVTVLAAAAALALAAPAPARAQQRDHGVRFDVHLDFGWYANAGVGVRADIPVVPDGIVDGVDDDLSLSLGAELFWFYRNEGFGVFPLAAMQWNFYLSEDWSLCPEIGVALWFGPDRNDHWRSPVAPFAGFGARYHFSVRNALLLRVTWPSGLQVGITF
jgi:hypothetical protein